MINLSSENLIFHLFIAIPTFFVLRWLLSRFIKQKTIKLITAFMATIVLTPFLYLMGVSIFFSLLFQEPSRKFDQNAWLANKTKRYQMAEDMINRKLLIGKDTNQVKNMLGHSTKTSQYKRRTDTLTEYTYDLGMGGGGLGFQLNYLTIKFNKGLVISVEQQTVSD
jgi:hypothetical protein